MVFGAISAIRTSGEMPAFRADGVGSGSVTVGDGGGVIGGDGSGPVVIITNVSMITDFGSTGGDAGSEEIIILASPQRITVTDTTSLASVASLSVTTTGGHLTLDLILIAISDIIIVTGTAPI